MKVLGEAALDLPWLAPCATSLAALARSPRALVWPQLRDDPGLVLLLARAAGPSARLFPDDETAPLEQAARHLKAGAGGFVDWSQPGPDALHRAARSHARLAQALAEQVGADPDRAWAAGLLAPLGWLAVAAADPTRVGDHLRALAQGGAAASWQQAAWGLDHTAIARRLARLWRLPSWLTAVVGHLGLHASIAERLGAEPKLFQVVQLAVRLGQQRDAGLALAVGGTTTELLTALHLGIEEAEALADATQSADDSEHVWQAPATQPLLSELLQLAAENRRQGDRAWVDGLQRDLDRLQEALERQCAEERERLQTLKLAALAELAAGAGHEINNPLAVISGQAQYVLKQFEFFDGPADEIEDIGAYLAALKEKVLPSLHKIVGQTQRIRGILTDLMQFARPPAPRVQAVELAALVREVSGSLEALARERRVRLVGPEAAPEGALHGDAVQLRAALASLLRNAIEAAPPDGFAQVRVERNCTRVDLIVEDNGPGPSPAAREHLFDPFFSGRQAGRGRGLGLPTAWRLARAHGGDVRLDVTDAGLTRFVLTLPLAPAE